MNIEPLESRIAPASATFAFTDVDGDIITVKISVPGPLQPADIEGAITKAETAVGSGKFQFQTLNLTDQKFQGASVNISAQPDPTAAANAKGDGFVNVGFINANGRDLGKVSVDGDLGKIVAGDNKPQDGSVKEVNVASMGKFGTDTQTAGGDLQTGFNGKAGKLIVKGDVKEAEIHCGQDFGDIQIGGNLIGGPVTLSGSITALGNGGSITIGGNVTGAIGAGSGTITIKDAKVIRVGGDIVGGDTVNTGKINANHVGKLEIGGGLTGGGSSGTGYITIDSAKTIVIGKALTGGAGTGSGSISVAGEVGTATIGPLKGGVGAASGQFKCDSVKTSITVKGGITGGDGEMSGSVQSGGNASKVTIEGPIQGGKGDGSGGITSVGGIKTLTVNGDILGGLGDGSGGIDCDGDLGTCSVSGDIVGGSIEGADSLERSGFIEASRILKLTLRGSLIAGEDDSTGTLARSGSIGAENDIGTLSIAGSCLGNESNSAVISGGRGLVRDFVFKSIKIGGSVEETDILAGYDVLSNPVNADTQIGDVTVGRDWFASNLVSGVFQGMDGAFGTADDVAINPIDNPGATNNPALFSTIAKITIKGQAQGETSAVIGSYGILAGKIGGLKTGGRTFEFTSVPLDDVLRIGATGGAAGDFFAREDVGT
jgi:hypothetical protein